MNMNPQKKLDTLNTETPEKSFSFLWITAEAASGEQFLLSRAVISKEWKEIVRLSRVTFNKICEDLRPFLDKKTLFALTQARN